MTEQQIALVTGANKGLGLAIAHGLLELGITVYLGARDVARGERAAASLAAIGPGARFVHLDVTDAASVGAAAERIAREQDALDVLVNNAGIIVQPVHPPSRTSVEDVRKTYETNVFGVIAVTNAVLPLLRASRAARIVNLTSDLGSLTGRRTNPTSRSCWRTTRPRLRSMP